MPSAIVFGPRQQIKLIHKHVREILVVADRSQSGRVDSQRHRRQGLAFFNDRMLELDRDMLRVAGRTAIAHGNQPARRD